MEFCPRNNILHARIWARPINSGFMKMEEQTKDYPETFYAFVEIAEGSDIKYEYKEDIEAIVADRFLFTSMAYPTNYGFIMGTLAKDNDPLDVLIVASKRIMPGTVIKCRAVGKAVMKDEEGQDNKIIAVPVEKVDPYSSLYTDIKDVPEALKQKLKHFFEHYKELEKGKFMKFESFEGKESAMAELKESRK